MFGFLASPCRCGSGCLDSVEVETYRGFFCGLANRLHGDYGPMGRFLVNRDATFLSLLTAAQAEEGPEAAWTTCCNPLAKKRARFQSGDHAEFAAAVTICGLTAKIRDEIEDGGALKRPVFRAAGRIMNAWERRATRVLEDRGFPVAEVRQELARQSALETRIASGEEDRDLASGPTRQAFGRIFEYSAVVAGREKNREATRQIGEELGDAIYWLDAVTDFEADRKQGRFNPFSDSTGAGASFGKRLEGNFRRIGEAFSALVLNRYEAVAETVLLQLTPTRALAVAGVEGSSYPENALAASSSKRKRKKRSGETKWWHHCCDSCCTPCDCCPSRGGGGSACDSCDACDCCPCDCCNC